MFEKEWPVLLVDDEPDVLAVSEVAMRSFRVDGRPIKLYTATSKAEAIDLLTTSLGGQLFPYLAVAFIDVVMETETAGLELCEFIREGQQNRLTQLYIRTGQPGVAPERSVIDRYDINGYFLKTELTEDKLYSLVKAGVRQFDFTNTALSEYKFVTRLIAASDSREHLDHELHAFAPVLPLDGAGRPSHDYQMRVSLIVGDWVPTPVGYTEAQVRAERDRLLRHGLRPLDGNGGNGGDGGDGDGYVVDGNDLLVRVAATDAHDEAFHLANFAAPPSPGYILLVHQFTKAVAALVRRADATARQPAAVG
jgi:CheY-like chemotaxis protein